MPIPNKISIFIDWMQDNILKREKTRKNKPFFIASKYFLGTVTENLAVDCRNDQVEDENMVRM